MWGWRSTEIKQIWGPGFKRVRLLVHEIDQKPPLKGINCQRSKNFDQKSIWLKTSKLPWWECAEKVFSPQGGNPLPKLTSEPLKNKSKGHILWRPIDKEIPLEARITAQWIKEVSHPRYSQCPLSGISELPRPSDCWLSPFPPLQISVSFFPHCYLLGSRERGRKPVFVVLRSSNQRSDIWTWR